MTHRKRSCYAGHPRITWFGIDGTVAYVDYVGANESFSISGDGHGGFMVIPPFAAEDEEVTGFDTIDAGIEYALAARDERRA